MVLRASLRDSCVINVTNRTIKVLVSVQQYQKGIGIGIAKIVLKLLLTTLLPKGYMISLETSDLYSAFHP